MTEQQITLLLFGLFGMFASYAIYKWWINNKK